ncbi:hypothetical protein B0A55_12756 [Friedmanniomyces simplex]|uniref:Uncharacterized protein n=1 Tax=Friedmanniomyces simplex TaxID=329884 RepID=A0A4U0VQ31_9PEZI|nr:hypothetical protein B0A55_12756 [Friedmanniomyces simplex]
MIRDSSYKTESLNDTLKVGFGEQTRMFDYPEPGSDCGYTSVRPEEPKSEPLGSCNVRRARRRRWQVVKDNGKHLFDPQQGGSYGVFDQRPLSKDIKEYCIQDVTFMPHLRDIYRRKLLEVKNRA